MNGECCVRDEYVFEPDLRSHVLAIMALDGQRNIDGPVAIQRIEWHPRLMSPWS